MNAGKVYLVGAGPGDPGLLTVRGKELLEAADVVVYDYLSNPKLLAHAPKAEHIYVGKKASQHTLTQDEINALLVKLGQQGRNVVRLKGGDPFVFGRGGEECEALRAANIAFEVVPGITAAIAGTAYAGIPVTHRDFNTSFTLVTGHEKDEEDSRLDWPTLAKLPCLAFYMGVKALPNICANLIANGMSSDTPAAVIQWATMPRQRAVTATIGTLVDVVTKAGIGAPAITIIGKVVTLRDTIQWFENRPLFGQTIVVTRTRQQASDLSRQLEALGAEVIEAPTIELVPPKSWDAVDAALKKIPSYDWVVFTSANGVTAARKRLFDLGLDSRTFANTKIAAIGDATARAIETELALRVDLVPESFVAEALADALESKNEIKHKKFLLLRADIARPILREKLQEQGAAEVSDIAIYETKTVEALPPELLTALNENRITWITFTSSSTVKNFLSLVPRQKLTNIKLASIGPITSQTLRENGLEPTVEAKDFNVDGLVKAIRSM